jgi:hypothetical protein
MYLLCKPILLAGRMGRRTHIQHRTLRGLMSTYPALARACHSGISSNDLEDLFIGNNIYIDYLRARHPTLLGHLAREGQRE